MFDSYVERYWTDLPVSMLTLIQFVNLDGIGAIYTPMVRSAPWAGLFFISFMLIVSICLMNLVTAVIVEGSFEATRMDREVEKAYSSTPPLPDPVYRLTGLAGLAACQSCVGYQSTAQTCNKDGDVPHGSSS